MDYDDYSNVTEVWDTEEQYLPYWPIIVMNLLQGVATVGGLCANAFLLALFVTPPRNISVTDTSLLQRAIADMIALVPYPFVIYGRIHGRQVSQAACKSFSVILHVGVVASTGLLMAFSLDSYLASFPQQYKMVFRRKTMRFTSLAAWVLAVIAGVNAGFLSDLPNGYCDFYPLFDSSRVMNDVIILQIAVLLIIPLVVVWALISVALPPRPMRVALMDSSVEGKRDPNRRLMLGLALNFTVLQGIHWLAMLLGHVIPSNLTFILIPIFLSLITFMEAINAILVICLTEELQRKAHKWLPSRRSASVPLQNL